MADIASALIRHYHIVSICTQQDIIAYTILIFSLLPTLLHFIGQPELYNYKAILLVFLVGNMFFNLSFTSHYALMAIHKDKPLMIISLAVAVVNIVLNVFAVIYIGIMGAVMVFCLSAFLLYIIKERSEKFYFNRHEW